MTMMTANSHPDKPLPKEAAERVVNPNPDWLFIPTQNG
jgi:hypothetical protein